VKKILIKKNSKAKKIATKRIKVRFDKKKSRTMKLLKKIISNKTNSNQKNMS
jgi:hypothetical protein